ncbi:MAG: hypothetical protein JXJ04_18490 [Spirochaetales bacterium]|nr:hypothetical protein [Spirochaetales bacterium]
MKINQKIIFFLIIGFIFIQSGSAAPIKAFILAGQSNMVGTGNIMDLPADLKGPQPNVMIYNGGTGEYRWITLEPGVGAYTGSFGPEVSFGHDISLAFPGETIALIKVAWSGTSLAYDWRPPCAGDTLGRLYTEFLNHVNNALATYPGNADLEITGMCWMQGESDATNIYPASEYEVNLTCFINDVRSEFNLPVMPFVIAMIERTPVWQEYEVVRTAQMNVAQTLPGIGIFDCDGFPSDGSHYYPAGLIQMGQAFAASMVELLSGVVQPGDTRGDVNGDQRVDILDALLIAQYYVGLNPSGFNGNVADVDNDGTITIIDALLIARYYVGLIDHL